MNTHGPKSNELLFSPQNQVEIISIMSSCCRNATPIFHQLQGFRQFLSYYLGVWKLLRPMSWKKMRMSETIWDQLGIGKIFWLLPGSLIKVLLNMMKMLLNSGEEEKP